MNNFKNSYAFVLKSIKKDLTLKPIFSDLKNKTYVVSGATRGIGFSIAQYLAKNGANVSMIGKTVSEHPKLENTIHSAKNQIINTTNNRNIISIPCDIRDSEQIKKAVLKTKNKFLGIDGVILNASALVLNNTLNISQKEINLLTDVNIKGSFLMGRECLKHIKSSQHGHVITISPPLGMLNNKDWWTEHFYYSMSKFNMSLMAYNWNNEFKNIGVNTLWPRTTIDTAPVRNILGGGKMVNISRKPDIMGISALSILKADPLKCTGNNYIDDEVCASLDIDTEQFKVNSKLSEKELMPDFFC